MERLAPLWDATAATLRLSAFAGSALALAYRAAFLPERARVVLHVLWMGDELAAVLPLERRGRLTRLWTAFDNEHVPVCDLTMRSDVPEVGTTVLQHLLAEADGLVLRRLAPDSPLCDALRASAEGLGAPLRMAAGREGDTYLRLGPWNDFEAKIPAKVRANIRARLARLEHAGRVGFRRVSGGPELRHALEECFEVEESGWKGRSGSPIRSRSETLRFYCDLAERASAAGQLALYVLSVDGTIIAFRYGLRGNGRLDSLKTGYRPAWGAFAPGVLTKYLMARREIEEGEIHTLHFGSPSADKLRWATGVRQLTTLRIYGRTGRARIAYIAPALVDGAVERWPAARTAIDWGRQAVKRLREETHRSRVRLGKRLASRRSDPPSARARGSRPS